MFSTAPVDSSDTREMEVKSLRTESIIYTPIQQQPSRVLKRRETLSVLETLAQADGRHFLQRVHIARRALY